MVVKFRSKSESEEVLHKLKKMKRFIHELTECFEEKMDEDEDYRYDDEDYEEEHIHPRGRGRSMRGRR